VPQGSPPIPHLSEIDEERILGRITRWEAAQMARDLSEEEGEEPTGE
jgi:hypothetical protein